MRLSETIVNLCEVENHSRAQLPVRSLEVSEAESFHEQQVWECSFREAEELVFGNILQLIYRSKEALMVIGGHHKVDTNSRAVISGVDFMGTGRESLRYCHNRNAAARAHTMKGPCYAVPIVGPPVDSNIRVDEHIRVFVPVWGFSE